MKIAHRFRFQVVWRLVLMAAAAGLFFYLLRRFVLGIPALLAAVAFVYLLISLFKYIDRSNRGLARFLQAVRYHDFSLSAGIDGLGGSFTDLNAAFREISGQFQRAREEKEEQYRYLQTVVQHIGVGLMTVQDDGGIDLFNHAAKRLLRVSHLRHIGDLPPMFQQLRDEIDRLRPGEKSLLKLDFPDEELHLSMSTTEFKLRDQLYKLISLQNIQVELEEKEAEAWQSLTRVLTHEIMNSLTPIASLAATAASLLPAVHNEGEGADSTRNQDVTEALQTIDRRSHGLMRFVHAYRSMALIPKPQFKIFPVVEMFQRMEKLLQDKRYPPGYRLSRRGRATYIGDDRRSRFDRTGADQSAAQCHGGVGRSHHPCIHLSSRMNERGLVVIQVSDNGPGIDPEVREKVFIPFFTTKKEGSGIGLSFSRQVMRLHHGVIAVQSQPGSGHGLYPEFLNP